MTPSEQRAEPPRAEFLLRRGDWGEASRLFRATAAVAWLALTARAIATALPGSRSGIETVIRRADVTSSLLSQLTVLLGGAQVVLFVVGALGERSLSFAYRIAIVPASAAVLMLVMLSSTMGLDFEMSLIVGASALVLAGAAGAVSLKSPASRAQGMVLLAVTAASAIHLTARVLALGLAPLPLLGLSRAPFLLTCARAADAVALALLAARLAAEGGMIARGAVAATLVTGTAITWGALHGSLEGAAFWQVVASRSLYELAGGPVSLGAAATRFGLESFAVLLGGTVVFWPARVSAGALSAALAVLARPSVDVPESALILALGALSAPIAVLFRSPLAEAAPAPNQAPESQIGADG